MLLSRHSIFANQPGPIFHEHVIFANHQRQTFNKKFANCIKYSWFLTVDRGKLWISDASFILHYNSDFSCQNGHNKMKINRNPLTRVLNVSLKKNVYEIILPWSLLGSNFALVHQDQTIAISSICTCKFNKFIQISITTRYKTLDYIEVMLLQRFQDLNQGTPK